jgi:hypothetical protein
VSFYEELLVALEPSLGTVDPNTLTAIVGFRAGGPVSLAVYAAGEVPTYVTSELAVVRDQAGSVPYELLMTGRDARWARHVLTRIAQLSLEVELDDLHTLDISAWVEDDCALKGVFFELFIELAVQGRPCRVLRVVGITERELAYAREHGVEALREELGAVYPRTELERVSAV